MPIVVMAYQDIGWVCLDELLQLGAEVAAVVTHSDAPDEEIWFRSVADRARTAGIPVLAPVDVNAPEVVTRLAALAPELLLSFYFRQILKPALLAVPSRGALNLHGSLLPRYRGRCPVNWVLVHGEAETGVTLHHMTPEPDAGDIAAQRRVPITEDDTALTLNRKLADAARLLLRATFPALLAGAVPRIPQDHARATTFGGRRPQDGRLVWQRPARELRNLVRAVTHPYPGAFAAWGGTKLFVWQTALVDGPTAAAPGCIAALSPAGIVVGTGAGNLRLTQLQLDGEGEERAFDFACRHGLHPGDRLENGPC